MNGNDFMGLVAVVALVTMPLVGTLLNKSKNDQSNEEDQGMSEIELYALRRAQKRNAMRRMRVVARENRRPTSRHHNNRR